jgi:hypothetical protein
MPSADICCPNYLSPCGAAFAAQLYLRRVQRTPP